MLLIPGYIIGIIEIALYFGVSFCLRNTLNSFNKINKATYYWLMMTALTGLWEASYIHNYNEISKYGRELVANNTHVWTNKYDLSYIMPNKLAFIFYAEYGAHADREYISLNDNWSHSIEGSHALFCALFSIIALTYSRFKNNNNYLVTVSVAMGTQIMNSLLYMDNYFIQCRDSDSPNFNTTSFPIGNWLSNRLFMWVNLFWIVMPAWTIIYLIIINSKQQKKI